MNNRKNSNSNGIRDILPIEIMATYISTYTNLMMWFSFQKFLVLCSNHLCYDYFRSEKMAQIMFSSNRNNFELENFEYDKSKHQFQCIFHARISTIFCLIFDLYRTMCKRCINHFTKEGKQEMTNVLTFSQQFNWINRWYVQSLCSFP